MAGVTIRVDPADIVQALEGVRNGVPRVVTRAINKTLTTVRTAVSRAMAEDTGIPVRQIQEVALKTYPANFGNLSGRLEVSGRRIPLIFFHATGPEPSRGRGQGVKYRIGSQSKLMRHAFITRLRSGHRGVFLRSGRARLPIYELFGPSLPKVAAQEKITAAMRDVGAKALASNLLHETQFLLVNRKGA